MKKFFLALAVLSAAAFSASAFSMNDIIWYFPNRIVDLTDIFSVGAGLYAGVKAEARVTRAIDASAGAGFGWMLRKDYHRWLAASLEKGYHFNLLCLGVEGYTIDEAAGFFFPAYKEGTAIANRYVDYHYKGFASPFDCEYDFWAGTRDWWEIAAEAGAGAYVRFAVHPVEIADFICGIFFIDFMDDDIGVD